MIGKPVARLDDDDVRSLRAVTSKICGDLLEESLTAPEVGLPFVPTLWDALEDAGLLRMGLGSRSNGDGSGWEAAAIVLAESARNAAPGPIMETSFLSEWLLDQAGVQSIAGGPVTTGNGSFTREADDKVRMSAERVPWARTADHVIVVGTLDDDVVVAVVPSRSAAMEDHANVAFQPRESVTALLDPGDLHRVDPAVIDEWLLRGALGRSVPSCGALERAVEMSIEHVKTRQQFRRSLSGFQAVQHLLASAASELAVATNAADVAVAEVSSLDFRRISTTLAVSAAKSQSSRAATVVARSCHQLHGVIGMTLDYPLRHFTLPALAWRNEFGNQSFWDGRIGRLAVTRGRGAWDLLTALAHWRAQREIDSKLRRFHGSGQSHFGTV